MVDLDVDYLNYLRGARYDDPEMEKFYSDVIDLLKLQSDISIEKQVIRKNGNRNS